MHTLCVCTEMLLISLKVADKYINRVIQFVPCTLKCCLSEMLPACSMFSTLPPLTVVNCGDPATPSHGIRDPDPVVTQLSNVVRYSCDEGYELLGSQERTCQSSGEWSGQLPTCRSELAAAVVQARTACSPSVGPLLHIHVGC